MFGHDPYDPYHGPYYMGHIKYLAKVIPNPIKHFVNFSKIMEIFQNFGNSDKQIMSTFDGQ